MAAKKKPAQGGKPSPILNGPYEEPVWHYATAEDGSLDYERPLPGRRVFAPTTEAGEVWRTAPFGYAGLNQIELHLSGDALDSYVHRFGAHVFRFDFEPALPPLPRLRGGESFAYAVSLDDAAGVVTGRIAAARDGHTVTLSWAPQTPPIMVSQPMTSVLVTQGEGYALSLRAD